MATSYPTGTNDPLWSKVILLMDGSSPTTDLSSSGRSITKYGDVYSTTAPDGKEALKFNKTGGVDYLLVNSTGVSFDGDWCFETCVWPLSYAGSVFPNSTSMLTKLHVSSGVTCEIYYTGYYGTWDGTLKVGTIQVPLNKWSHVTTSKEGTTHRIFVNGTQCGSFESSRTPDNLWRIGGDPDVGNGRSLDGYMRDIRFTNGAARYTSDFYPICGGSQPANAMMFSCNT